MNYEIIRYKWIHNWYTLVLTNRLLALSLFSDQFILHLHLLSSQDFVQVLVIWIFKFCLIILLDHLRLSGSPLSLWGWLEVCHCEGGGCWWALRFLHGHLLARVIFLRRLQELLKLLFVFFRHMALMIGYNQLSNAANWSAIVLILG